MTLNPTEDETDEVLMQLYQEGSEQAFSLIYKRHSSKIYGYLHHRLRDRALEEDVFQATWLRLHRTRFQYRPEYPFLPWLFTLCRSTLIDAARVKKKTRREELNPEAIEEAVAHPQVESESEALGAMENALSDLSDTQKKAITLRYSDGLSFEAIASNLETSPSNVRQIISRGVRRVRSFFEKERRT